MPTTAEATLATHCGAQPISREDLRSLSTPPSTRTHTTVPHYQLVDTIETALNEQGVYVAKQEFAVQGTDGAKMFGVLTLKKSEQPDFSYAIGLRASNDKTLAIQLAAGLRVFVCDNLALSGDMIALLRKHTSGLVLEDEIRGGVTRALGKFTVLDTRIQALKSYELGDQRAKSIVVDAVMQDVIPARLLEKVVAEYLEPKHPEFLPRTPWSLYNAFTEHFREPHLKVNVAFQATLKLAKLFRL